MKRRSRIITFIVVAALTYGGLFTWVGPEKVRTWHKQHHIHHGHHHDHDCFQEDDTNGAKN